MSPQDKTSSMERRPSTRQSLRLSAGGGRPESDEYDLSAMLVSDGFRPSNMNTAADSSSNPPSRSVNQPQPGLAYQNPQPAIPPIAASASSAEQDYTPEPSFAMRNRPTSISKPPRSHDSLTLRNEGSSGPPVIPVPAALAGLHSQPNRHESISSDAPVIRAESPYTGPSGPSHPYQMYPQRTLSVATTSTSAAPLPDQRSYNGPTGPTHPYAMYSQNTAPTSESAEQQIPLGFNGGNYQRQLGPDGEEAGDLIGPLGHTEELPPYSRYPDNTFAPKPAPDTPSTEPETPAQDIAGAGGIGIATRNPEFSSTDDDLALPRTRPSMRSTQSQNDSHHDINTAARDVAEKPRLTKWQRRAKKKLWGIVPYWAICLLAVGLVLMGIIMGAVIGTVLTKGKKNPPPPPPTQATDAYGDVYETPKVTPTPLDAVPTSFSTISTGVFAIPTLSVRSAPPSCINDSTQEQAWSCEVPWLSYTLNIQKDSGKQDTSCYNIQLVPNTVYNEKTVWGAQPYSPDGPLQLTLVNDTTDLDKGPAWHTQLVYNKQVYVASDKIDQLNKRGYHGDDLLGTGLPRFGKQPLTAGPNDTLWICNWPNITMDFFIYPQQRVGSLGTTTTTTPDTPTPTPTPAVEKKMKYDGEDDDDKKISGREFQARGDDIPPPFTRAVRVVERRMWTGKSFIASCRQFQVDASGKLNPKLNSDGTQIEIVVKEKRQARASQKKREVEVVPKRWYARELLARGDKLELTSCACEWLYS